MNKIQCPNCGEVFEIDESKYSEIVAQVRNEQFEKDIELSRPYTAEDRAKISVWEKIAESISRLLTEIL